MTETTATTGTSPDEVEAGSGADDHAASQAKGRPAEEATGEATPSADANADGQAVGRASVPSADSGEAAPSGGLRLSPELSGAEKPTYTRPPGMSPPPMSLADDDSEATRRVPAGVAVPAGGIRVSPSGAYPLVTASASVSAPPRTTGVTVRPIGGTATGTAKVATPPARPAASPRGPRRARLAIKRIDPWS